MSTTTLAPSLEGYGVTPCCLFRRKIDSRGTKKVTVREVREYFGGAPEIVFPRIALDDKFALTVFAVSCCATPIAPQHSPFEDYDVTQAFLLEKQVGCALRGFDDFLLSNQEPDMTWLLTEPKTTAGSRLKWFMVTPVPLPSTPPPPPADAAAVPFVRELSTTHDILLHSIVHETNFSVAREEARFRQLSLSDRELVVVHDILLRRMFSSDAYQAAVTLALSAPPIAAATTTAAIAAPTTTTTTTTPMRPPPPPPPPLILEKEQDEKTLWDIPKGELLSCARARLLDARVPMDIKTLARACMTRLCNTSSSSSSASSPRTALLPGEKKALFSFFDTGELKRVIYLELDSAALPTA